MTKLATPQIDASRAATRRRQVLDAATRCFTQRGFHGASIAQIGIEAGMSAGHIYRYFTNKEEIIAGIVERHLDEARKMISEIEDEADDLTEALIECADRGVDKALDPLHAMMMVEVKAESARNPKLAAILHAADAEMRDHMRRVIAQATPADWPPEEVEIRSELLALTFEGLPLRMLANPTLDRPTMVRMMRFAVAAILQQQPVRRAEQPSAA